MDKIIIRDLEVFANHGVFPEENVLGQKFLVSAILYTNTKLAGKTDDLQHSIDYGKVSHFIHTYLQKNIFKLIETMAEHLARELLLNTLHLEKIQLTIKKPWAPIGLSVDYAAVEITRQWHTVYLALGSNIGNKEQYLQMAVMALKEHPECRVEAVSSWIETEPYGEVVQDNFLNGCLELRTLLAPQELLVFLQEVEQQAGRQRDIHWGPRTLDLDIIFYDDLIFHESNLCIPHVEMHKRAFVLEPLCEIAPYFHHPMMGQTVQELKEKLE